MERPRLAAVPVAGAVAAILAVHFSCLTQYGWFRDELYYLSCSHRLAWGYVDQPPLSIALLALVRGVAGDHLAALRIASALLSAAGSLVAALIARELGGRTFAQVMTALALGLAPLSLALGHYYSMNVIDMLLWAVATLLTLRVFTTRSRATWVALGVVLGLALLNKWSALWLGGGIAVALVISPARTELRRAGPWLALAIAALLVAPNLLWERSHDWATFEFMHNARTHKMAALDPLKFLLEHVLTMGPANALFWVAGLFVSLLRPNWRPLAVLHTVLLAILLASGSARVSYLALATPALLAAGAVWWEERPAFARRAVGALVLMLAVPIAPLALPILPIPTLLAYQKALHREPRTEERHRMGVLTQQYADMFGWPELADSVAKAAATLSPAERAAAIVVVGNYGEAGALEHFGAGRVPQIVCQHNNFYLWGPPQWDGRVAMFVGRDSAEVAGEFAGVRVVGIASHPLAMPYEQDMPIIIAHGFRSDLAKAWPAGKHYE